MKHSLLTLFVTLALITAANPLCFSQSVPAAPVLTKKQEKIRQKVIDIGITGKITVIRLDKKKFYGTVTRVTNNGFEIREVDLKVTMEFDYVDLLKVNRGDGEKNLITGKRNNPQKGWLYGLAIIGALVTIVVVVASDKDF